MATATIRAGRVVMMAALLLSGMGLARIASAGTMEAACCFRDEPGDNASCNEGSNQGTCDALEGVLVQENSCEDLDCEAVLNVALGHREPAPAASTLLLIAIAGGLSAAGWRRVRRRSN